ncbi:MAG: DNA repair protein RecO [Ardenticatenales bacterium]|jgi:DNA repair protein RecO (recombination protein O)|nr:DNA repair protein RecO [Ardenticatenales bacterium]
MSRVRLQKAEAIVLKRHDYGEADRILTVYTRQQGKITVIAKGVRRIASRKAGHVELFTHAQMMLAEGRNMDVLTQAEMIEAFPRLRDDLVRMTYAYHIAELVDRFEQDGHPSPQTFQLLRDSLAALGDADDPFVVARYFELRYLSLIGYRPHLFECAQCATSLEPGAAVFSPEAGGVVCPACARAVSDGLRIDDAAFRVLRFLQTREIGLILHLVLQSGTRGQVEQALHGFVRHHLERELRSVEFLNGLRRVARTVDLAPSARARPDTVGIDAGADRSSDPVSDPMRDPMSDPVPDPANDPVRTAE